MAEEAAAAAEEQPLFSAQEIIMLLGHIGAHDNYVRSQMDRGEWQEKWNNWRGEDDYDYDDEPQLDQGPDYNYYAGSELWNRVAKEIGITGIDNESDLVQMYDYVKGYDLSLLGSGEKAEAEEETEVSELDEFDAQTQAEIDELTATANASTINATAENGIPATNYVVQAEPISLSNPYQKLSVGGIEQFRAGGQDTDKPNQPIQSNMVNI